MDVSIQGRIRARKGRDGVAAALVLKAGGELRSH